MVDADVAGDENSDSEYGEKHEEVEDRESSVEVDVDREYVDLESFCSSSCASALDIVVEDMTDCKCKYGR